MHNLFFSLFVVCAEGFANRLDMRVHASVRCNAPLRTTFVVTEAGLVECSLRCSSTSFYSLPEARSTRDALPTSNCPGPT